MVRIQQVSFIVISGVSGKLMEVSNKFNEHSSMTRVMIDVPFLSQELVDRGNGAHTSLSWMLETHTHS